MIAQVKGLFWNYYSVGLDAQAAYGFHSMREKRPWAAPSRTINQGWYSYYSCTSGWFCNAPPMRNKVALKVCAGPEGLLLCLQPDLCTMMGTQRLVCWAGMTQCKKPTSLGVSLVLKPQHNGTALQWTASARLQMCVGMTLPQGLTFRSLTLHLHAGAQRARGVARDRHVQAHQGAGGAEPAELRGRPRPVGPARPQARCRQGLADAHLQRRPHRGALPPAHLPNRLPDACPAFLPQARAQAPCVSLGSQGRDAKCILTANPAAIGMSLRFPA